MDERNIIELEMVQEDSCTSVIGQSSVDRLIYRRELHADSAEASLCEIRIGINEPAQFPVHATCVIPADQSIFWRLEGSAEFMVIGFNKQLLNELKALNFPIQADAPRRLYSAVPVFDPVVDRCAQLMTELISDLLCPSRQVLRGFTHILGVHLLDRYSHSQKYTRLPIKGLSQNQLNKVRAFVEARLDEDISRADLADLCGLSRFHFSKLFKESLKMTPHQYIISRRIEKARRLLRDSSMPIAHVSDATGFSSQSHLTTVFRKLVGVTPRHYRLMDI